MQLEVAALLLAHGADPDLKNFAGNTPADYAETRNPELAAFLRKASEDKQNQKN